MARIVLLVAGVTLLIGAVAAASVAIAGTDLLEALLPPLAIDTAALGGAITAVGGALGLAGLAHVAVLLGLRAGSRRALSAAILLGGLGCAVFTALAAASFASAAAEPAMTAVLLAGGAAAVVAAGGYLLATARLVRELAAAARR